MEEALKQDKNLPGLWFACWYGMIASLIMMLGAIPLNLIGINLTHFFWGWRSIHTHLLTTKDLPVLLSAMVLVGPLCLFCLRLVASVLLRRYKKSAFWICLISAIFFAVTSFIRLCLTIPGWRYLSLQIEWSMTGPIFLCECVVIAILLSGPLRQHFL